MDMKNLRRSDFDYWTAITTRWRDIDALGHLNHAIYLEYMETARVDVYTQLGFTGIRKDMDESTILGSMDVHYLTQVKHPASLDVGRTTERTERIRMYVIVVHTENKKRILVPNLNKNFLP